MNMSLHPTNSKKMHRIYLLLVVSAGLFSPALQAQEPTNKSIENQSAASKGLENINRQTIEAYLSFLASDALEGREAGKKGGAVAAEYIQSVLKGLGIKPFYATYFQSFEAYSPARERGLDFQVDPDSIAKYKQSSAYRRLNLKNVIGYIEGQKKEEYIVIGAHYDHVGVDELLVGDPIYNGADDNAASVAAILQVAKTFAESGEKPLRNILFAFWDGEEVNYLGSEYFVAHFASPANIKTYINLDMISREGYVPILYPEFAFPETITEEINATGKQFHLLYTKDLERQTEEINRNIEKNKLNIQAKPRILEGKARGSDNLSFALREIPVVWFFTGLHPDYHTPDDEMERFDWDKLTDITKATYLTLRNLVNDESLK
jgi:hypothetical protein